MNSFDLLYDPLRSCPIISITFIKSITFLLFIILVFNTKKPLLEFSEYLLCHWLLCCAVAQK